MDALRGEGARQTPDVVKVSTFFIFEDDRLNNILKIRFWMHPHSPKPTSERWAVSRSAGLKNSLMLGRTDAADGPDGRRDKTASGVVTCDGLTVTVSTWEPKFDGNPSFRERPSRDKAETASFKIRRTLWREQGAGQRVDGRGRVSGWLG